MSRTSNMPDVLSVGGEKGLIFDPILLPSNDPVSFWMLNAPYSQIFY